MESKSLKLIHAACVNLPKKGWQYLLLRKKDPNQFTWYEHHDDQEEIETEVSGPNIEEAIRLAVLHWKRFPFRMLNCGFRYTLPERDEHGINALFHQMVSSYNSMNGVYFDEDLGNNCFVNFASMDARELRQKLLLQKKL